MKRLRIKILMLSGVFLILSSCVHTAVEQGRFPGRWELVELVPGQTWACLNEQDVILLRRTLSQCGCQK